MDADSVRPRRTIRNPILRYLRNLLVLVNKATVTALGKDPRMTISAVSHLHGFGTLVRLIDWLTEDGHCEAAAAGWDDPAVVDMSVWKTPRK